MENRTHDVREVGGGESGDGGSSGGGGGGGLRGKSS